MSESDSNSGSIFLIGSITTIPARINRLYTVLKSILNQTRKLDKLYLNIPYKSKKGISYVIPPFLEKMIKDNKIIILNRCNDYGPITKIYPTLIWEQKQDTYIISFDDDKKVSPTTIEKIELSLKKYPECALSFSGYRAGSFPFYVELFNHNTQDVEVDWLQGADSITYPSWLIDGEELINFKYPGQPSFLEKHDDHRISAYLSSKNIKKISIGYDCREHFKDMSYCSVQPISGSMSFLYEVFCILLFYKSKGLYNKSCLQISNTYGFKFLTFLAFIFVLFKYYPFIYKNVCGNFKEG